MERQKSSFVIPKGEDPRYYHAPYKFKESKPQQFWVDMTSEFEEVSSNDGLGFDIFIKFCYGLVTFFVIAVVCCVSYFWGVNAGEREAKQPAAETNKTKTVPVDTYTKDGITYLVSPTPRTLEVNTGSGRIERYYIIEEDR